MRVEKSVQRDVTILSLIGELDGMTAAEVYTDIQADLPERGDLLLDLGHMTYVSSAGLRILLLVYRQARLRRQRLALAAVPPDVHAVMSATGFLDSVHVAESVQDGLEAFGR
ncbi:MULTISPECIES: anti-sigma factor antagonist [Catenuloplanes]|uniref:Anti-sigma factor antagonist n=1 Tax=Catenuloplanes niger TaxID=587534 RepID=A0AAE4A0X3_9ACTN|nr:anti-sigma factor antagonist [Catenuloplanes niger]MDR7327563.1 anti-anti-sigma factor [Catenuloplanes niger]